MESRRTKKAGELMMRQNAEENLEPGSQIDAEYFRTGDRAFCLRCQKPVDLMTYSKSAEFFKTDLEDIRKHAESGDLHRIHNRRGEMMICCNSLFTFFDSRETRPLDPKHPSLRPEEFREEIKKKSA